jgi:mono/diheme cytochrome c family protein
MKTILLLWCLLVLTGCRDSPVQLPALSVPHELLRQAEQQNAGEQLFFKHCRECHGTMREGRTPRAGRFVPPAPDFISPSYRSVAPDYLYWRIAKGKQLEPFRRQGSVMPAWGPHLSERQIWQLVAYLRQRGGAN